VSRGPQSQKQKKKKAAKTRKHRCQQVEMRGGCVAAGGRRGEHEQSKKGGERRSCSRPNSLRCGTFFRPARRGGRASGAISAKGKGLTYPVSRARRATCMKGAKTIIKGKSPTARGNEPLNRVKTLQKKRKEEAVLGRKDGGKKQTTAIVPRRRKKTEGGLGAASKTVARSPSWSAHQGLQKKQASVRIKPAASKETKKNDKSGGRPVSERDRARSLPENGEAKVQSDGQHGITHRKWRNYGTKTHQGGTVKPSKRDTLGLVLCKMEDRKQKKDNEE